MPSLSSFINSSQYSTESTALPLIAGMQLGTTYAAPTFGGVSGAASTDPGGLFGWLIYARNTFYSPAKGTTGDTYIAYSNPQDLVGDLNQLSGVTACLISAPFVGATYGFFETAGTVNGVVQLVAQTPGTDFLHAINYLAYGGTLVITGSTTGLSDYISTANTDFDIIIGKQATSGLCQWLISKSATTGVFPSSPDSMGVTGKGITMADYATLFGSVSYVTGLTVSNRMFNVYGVKTVSNLDTSSLQSNTQITYTIPATGDVGGFFVRSKNRNEQYLTVAGVDRSTVLNGNIINAIDWNDTLKTTLRNNRVNFFVNYNPKFLGADLVGATASSATVTADDRIGPSRLRSVLSQSMTAIGLKYNFSINNATTRANVTSELQSAIDPFTPFIDTTRTQIICDSSNNTDNSSTLVMTVILKPVLSTETFTLTMTFIL